MNPYALSLVALAAAAVSTRTGRAVKADACKLKGRSYSRAAVPAKSYATCPGCAGSFQVTSTGRVERVHGWNAIRETYGTPKRYQLGGK